MGSFLQQPGATTWDTKLDLTADPGGFLARALHLWNPEASFGELQNQAYGYFFPHGPFFWLGDALGAPDWVVQRLWSGLLLVVAYEGTRLVARHLGLGPVAGVLAGLVYALSPRMLGSSGVLTGEVLPGALLPWAAVPVLAFAAGRLSARQAGLWSGVAVLCMGGVNGAGTLAVLPLPALLVLAQWRRRPGGRALAGWWAAGVAAACAWWVVPLVVLGRYSPPFLDFIETAAATTSPTGWANDVRGADHWLAYYAIGDQAWWPGARMMVTEPWLVVAGGLVAALGLAGLAHREMPWRRVLLGVAVLGLLCLTAGNPGLLGSLVDAPVRALLDGPLAPLRNVHKVDPLVRLPLALGAGHAVVVLARALPATAGDGARRLVVVAAAGVVLVAGAPLLTGDLRMPGYDALPDAWAQASAHLEEASPQGTRALVVPGSGFGLQTWGWTVDEPMQAVAATPWATRSQVPLVPGPTARFLDVVERRLASGEGSPALADLLARAGVSHVVLRRDLNPFVAATASPERTEVALVASPGIEKEASFGSSGFGEQALIDVFRVERDVTPVTVVEAGDLNEAAGTPDDVLTALEAEVLDPTRLVVGPPGQAQGGVDTDTDPATDPATAADQLVADGLRRVEREFGRVHDAVSQVMSADEPWRSTRASRDFAGPAGTRLATAEFDSGVRVTASTSEGYAEELGAVRPEFGPHAAFDGDLATEWHSGALRRPDRQWWQIDLPADLPETLGGQVMAVHLELGGSAARVTRMRVSFGSGGGPTTESTSVLGVPDDGLLLVPLPREPISSVRLAVVEATGPEAEVGRVMVREVVLPGVEPGRSTVLAGTLGPQTSLALRLDPPRRPCLDLGFGPLCDVSDARSGEDAGRLDRTVEVAEGGGWTASGRVVAVPGPASAGLLAPVDRRARARASSVLGGDPAVSGQFAVDGSPGTAWLTDPRVERASLSLRWSGGPRTVTGIRVVPAGGAAAAPTTAVVIAGGERRVVPLAYLQSFEPLRTSGFLRVLLLRPTSSLGVPMGVAEVEVAGLEGLEAAPDLEASTGAVCGLGPQVVVDDEVRDTAVSGTLDDVRLGRPLDWRVCDGPITLAPGRHRIVVEPTAQFQPVVLGLRPTATPTSKTTVTTRTVEIERWAAADRSVRVGPGEEAVLRVSENPNPGWEATLEGRRLAPVTVDGWQQGYRVPAGEGGVVSLRFAPDGTYRLGLLIGALLAGLLVLTALGGGLLERRRRPAGPVEGSAGPAVAAPTAAPRPLTLATGLVLLVAGGPVAAAGLAAASWRRRLGWAWAVGGGLVGLSAVLSVLSPGLARGAPGVGADAAAAAGVGLLVGAALLDGGDRAGGWRQATGRRLARAAAWLRARPTLLVGLALVGAQTALRAVVVSGSYFWQDDFLHLDLSRTLGLSFDYLVRDYSGHLEPGQYLVMWAIGRVGEGSWVPAVVTLVVLQAVASLLLLALLRSLFGSSPWVLVPFAAYLVTPLGLATATWLAAGLQAFPLQIAMLGAALGAVRYLATGRRRWAVLSVVAHALGLACWQKAGVVLPFLLALEVLVLAQGLPLRARGRRLWDRRWFWLGHAGLLAAYVAVYLSVTGSGDLGAPADRSLLATLHDMLVRTLLPGLFGLPWGQEGAGNTIYPDTPAVAQAVAAALLLGLVAASVVRSGRAAWAGWLLVVGYLAADVALVLLGRGAYLLLVARDPRYVTDALPVIVIGVCAAFAAGRPARRPARGPAGGPARGPDASRGPRARHLLPTLPWLLVLVVLTSGLVSTLRLAPTTQHPQSESYVRTLTQALVREPGAAVLLTPVPADVAVSVNAESLLRAVGREQRLDRPGAEPRLIGPGGDLVPARLAAPDVTAQGPTPGCGWSLGEQETSLTVLPPAEDPTARVLRLSYVAAESGVLLVEVDGQTQAVAHEAGLGEVYVVVGSSVGAVRARVEPEAEVAATDQLTDPATDRAAGRFCLAELQRGTAVPAG
ncbi:alpha-(1-_3)-arabinofuranosyltransferase domain-containing protein [Nocardioides nanhaiensis]|uniref:alpha-(1->3)-arabinofuranosyltransferase domain-containing protein n=1 Tax=Nocardioides nanhaiensis TaxID=1476871 RepID=UPI0031EBB05B